MGSKQESRRTFLQSAVAACFGTAIVPIERIQAAPRKQATSQKISGRIFFNSDEADFVSAAIDRFIPPDEEWPGAVEAGVLDYIDQQMAGKWGSGGYMYWHGPFREGTPSQGYQLPFTPAQLFRRAIGAITEHFRAQGTTFRMLSEAEKDKYLQTLLANETTLNGIPSKTFADFLLRHTIEGFFADPIYGGNRDMTAWKMLGFPGPYADYYELIDQYGVRLDREPVSIANSSRHHKM